MASTGASIRPHRDPPHVAGVICSLPTQGTIAPQALWHCWFDHHDVAAAGRLVNAHLNLVVDIAGEYDGDGTASEELIAEGYVGLMRALCHYDPDWDVDFPTYASWWIRTTIQRSIPYPRSAMTSYKAAPQRSGSFNAVPSTGSLPLSGARLTPADCV
jgi:hypothetical protein